MKALEHVVRQHILLEAIRGPISPNELSAHLGEGVSQVSYHFKVLRDYEYLEEVHTEQRRGAVEHYYRATSKTLLPAKTWRRLKKRLRAVVGTGLASDLFNDLAEALNAGKLQGSSDYFARTPLVLDVKGRHNVKAIARRATEEVEDEQRAVADRVAKSNGDGKVAVGYTFGLLAFETAWEVADKRGHPNDAVRGGDGASRRTRRGTGESGAAVA